MFFERFAIALLLICPSIFGYLSMHPSRQHFSPSVGSKEKKVTSLGLWATSFSDLPPSQNDWYLSEDSLAQSVELLGDAIAFNRSAASGLLENVQDMRQKKSPTATINEYLDSLLAAGPDSDLPSWTRPRWLGRLSRRARLYSLRRSLDMTTPPPSDFEKGNKDEQEKQRRRRALMSLLNSIAKDTANETKVPIIVSIERKAKKASREISSDLRSRLPEGLESPEYDVLTELKSSKTSVEVRRYKPYSVCAVSMTKPRPKESKTTDAKVQMPEMKGASAFGALAGYLFGKNEKSQAMQMTTPVFTSPGAESAEEQQMAFVLPSTYWSSEQFQTAPQPLSGSGVKLEQKDSEDRAVLMFGGYASKSEVAKRKKELKEALSKDTSWRVSGESLVVAQYNDPFTVPWRRLNEVSVKVESTLDS